MLGGGHVELNCGHSLHSSCMGMYVPSATVTDHGHKQARLQVQLG